MDVLAGFLIVIALVDERRRQAVRRVPHGNHSPAHNLARGLAHAAQAVTNIAAFIVIIARQAHAQGDRSEEHTSELQSLMRSSYAVFCLKKKKKQSNQFNTA